MEEGLRFFFDKKSDVLDISIGAPRKAVSEEIEKDILVRKNPKTGEVIGFTILNFEKRFEELKKTDEIDLPIKLSLTPLESGKTDATVST